MIGRLLKFFFQEREFKSYIDKLFEIFNKVNPQNKSRLEEAIKYITTRKYIFLNIKRWSLRIKQ